MANNTNHDSVTSGNAIPRPRIGARWGRGTGGTIELFMSTPILSSSLFAITANGVGVRALWVVILALTALAFLDRMKPATTRRAVMIRVDNKPAPLYSESEQDQKWKVLTRLSGGAIILGALIACILGFIFTIAFEFVGGLLRA